MTLKNAVVSYLEAVRKTAKDKTRLAKIIKVVSKKQISDPDKVREFCRVLLNEMKELNSPEQFAKIIPLAQYCLNQPKISMKPKRK